MSSHPLRAGPMLMLKCGYREQRDTCWICIQTSCRVCITSSCIQFYVMRPAYHRHITYKSSYISKAWEVVTDRLEEHDTVGIEVKKVFLWWSPYIAFCLAFSIAQGTISSKLIDSFPLYRVIRCTLCIFKVFKQLHFLLSFLPTHSLRAFETTETVPIWPLFQTFGSEWCLNTIPISSSMRSFRQGHAESRVSIICTTIHMRKSPESVS